MLLCLGSLFSGHVRIYEKFERYSNGERILRTDWIVKCSQSLSREDAPNLSQLKVILDVTVKVEESSCCTQTCALWANATNQLMRHYELIRSATCTHGDITCASIVLMEYALSINSAA